jgi:hypothetical protein
MQLAAPNSPVSEPFLIKTMQQRLDTPCSRVFGIYGLVRRKREHAIPETAENGRHQAH